MDTERLFFKSDFLKTVLVEEPEEYDKPLLTQINAAAIAKAALAAQAAADKVLPEAEVPQTKGGKQAATPGKNDHQKSLKAGSPPQRSQSSSSTGSGRSKDSAETEPKKRESSLGKKKKHKQHQSDSDTELENDSQVDDEDVQDKKPRASKKRKAKEFDLEGMTISE
jgi:hypothetical protein